MHDKRSRLPCADKEPSSCVKETGRFGDGIGTLDEGTLQIDQNQRLGVHGRHISSPSFSRTGLLRCVST